MFDISWSPDSLKQIAEFAGVGILLDKNVQEAMKEISALLIQKTHDNALARFVTNSPGGLAESFYPITDSLYEIQVGSDAPHSHRRDAGFDSADSLGRVYHDPPYLYFTDAVNEVDTSGEGMELLQAAVMKALPGG